MAGEIGWMSNALDALWVGWILYWAGEPLYQKLRGKSKAVVRKGRWGGLTYVLLIAGFAVLQVSFTGELAFLGSGFLPATLPVLLFGFMVAVAGLAFSVWARLYLGSNWSPTAMLRKGQTLVRTGPYALVRHPIYLGLTVAIIGTAIVFGGYRTIVSIACVLVFSALRITEEDRLMTTQFGDEYSEYKKEVKGFIPGIV